MHTEPNGHLRHAPAPLHIPSWPQVQAASCAHSLSGSVPPMTGAQVPSAPAVLLAAHALHAPLQAESQLTPSTQKPVLHSLAPPQAAPCAFSPTQNEPEQKLP